MQQASGSSSSIRRQRQIASRRRPARRPAAAEPALTRRRGGTRRRSRSSPGTPVPRRRASTTARGPVVPTRHREQALRTKGAVEGAEGCLVRHGRVVGAVDEQHRWRLREVVSPLRVALQGAREHGGGSHPPIAQRRVRDQAVGRDGPVRMTGGADPVPIHQPSERATPASRFLEDGAEHEAHVLGLVHQSPATAPQGDALLLSGNCGAATTYPAAAQ